MRKAKEKDFTAEELAAELEFLDDPSSQRDDSFRKRKYMVLSYSLKKRMSDLTEWIERRFPIETPATHITLVIK